MPWAAVGAVVGGGLAYAGSKEQADAAREGAGEATGAQLQMYEQTREDYAPWREAGINALNAQLELLGLPASSGPVDDLSLTPTQRTELADWQRSRPSVDPPRNAEFLDGRYGSMFDETTNEFNVWRESAPEFAEVDESGAVTGYNLSGSGPQTATESSQGRDPTDILRSTPGYQFQLEEGLKARERAASASGRLYSGAQLKELTRYSQGLADQTFGDYFNRLGVIAGTGQTATRDITQVGQGVAGNLGNLAMVNAGAQGAHAINTANIGTNLMNNFADIYATRNFNSGNSGGAGSNRSDYTGKNMRTWVGNQ